VRYTEWRAWDNGEVVARELYDHVGDPNETRNAVEAPEMADALAEAKSLLEQTFPRR
jgi:iduronate 2-sulfatase